MTRCLPYTHVDQPLRLRWSALGIGSLAIGLFLSFPYPLAFSGTPEDISSVWVRIGPGDWIIAAVGLFLVIDRHTFRLSGFYPVWLGMVLFGIVSAGLCSVPLPAEHLVLLAAVAGGCVLYQLVSFPDLRSHLYHGFLIGLIVLLCVLYYDLLQLMLGRSPVYFE